MQYRKKPVTVEAVPTREALRLFERDWKNLPMWLMRAYDRGEILPTPEGLHINTLEGKMFSSVDDIIIQGVQGEIYSCKPDIFAATYEKVE